MKNTIKNLRKKGFSIPELITVIVVMGILVTIVAVAYNGVQASARDKSILSDLDALDGIQTRYGLKNAVAGKEWYSPSGNDSDINFTPSQGNIIDVVINSTDYCIRGYNVASTYNTIVSAAQKESSPGVCAAIPASSAAISGSP